MVAADASFGAEGVLLSRITDARHCLTSAEFRRLESLLLGFEARFPQLFLAIVLGDLASESELREFGFWVLNRSAVAGVDITRPNENGILVVADPARCLAGIVLGSQVESVLAEHDLCAVLRDARQPFRHRGVAAGLRCIVGGLTRELRRRADGGGPAAPADGARGPLSGLRRLRLGRQSAAKRQSSEGGE
jgi:hypothetical protein